MIYRVGLTLLMLGVLIALVTPRPAAAISDPDLLLLNTVRGYTGVIETGDLLVTVAYTLNYSVLPTETVNTAYIGRFLRGSSELNQKRPPPFNNRGYGLGFFGFYWTATERAADSVEFNDPNGEAYEVRLQGKPGVFPGAPPSIATTTIIWRNTSLLEADITEIAFTLEQDAAWVANQVDLVGSFAGRTVFTSSGETYFSQTVANLSAMVPNLFTLSITSPAVFERDDDERPHEAELGRFLDNTSFSDFFGPMARTLNLDEIYVRSIFSLVLIILIVLAIRQALSDVPNGTEFALATTALTIPLFASWGMLSFTIAGIVAFLAFAAIGWALFGRRAG